MILDDDLEIEFEKAEQSIEHDRGLAAYYKASADEKQRLLDIARDEHAKAKHYQHLLEAEQVTNQHLIAENARLRKENELLRARPTILTDQYVAQQNVYRQEVQRQMIAYTPRKRTKKNKYEDFSNQLTLWTNPTATYL